MVAGLKDIDTVITGHSRVMTWKDAQEWGRFSQDFFNAVQSAKRAGKSQDVGIIYKEYKELQK